MTAGCHRWQVPIVSTTLGMILLTNLFVAPLTGPLIRSLQLQAQGAELDEVAAMDSNPRRRGGAVEEPWRASGEAG